MDRVEDLIIGAAIAPMPPDSTALLSSYQLTGYERHVLNRALMLRIRVLQREGAGTALADVDSTRELYAAFRLLERFAMGG